MIALFIIGLLLLIIVAVLFLPICVILKYENELFLKVKFSGFGVYKFKQQTTEEEKIEKNSIGKTEKEKSKQENKILEFFKKLKKKYGFSGAVKLIFGFLRDLLPHIKKLLKHIKIYKAELDITVAEDDAAKTAIEYGSICGVVYPFLSALGSMADIKYKAINIRSDFDSAQSNFKMGVIIRTRIFFLLIALFNFYLQYKKFTARIENDERK